MEPLQVLCLFGILLMVLGYTARVYSELHKELPPPWSVQFFALGFALTWVAITASLLIR